MNGDFGRQVLMELRSCAQALQQNWNDEIAQEYDKWITQAEQRVLKIEGNRENLGSRMDAVDRICDEAINLEGTDAPKVLRKE